MTDDLENPGQWRDTVQTRLGKLEATVGEQARLRAAMDEDLSKLRVDHKLLQSLHIIQQDHTKRLTRLEVGMGEVTQRLGAVEGRLENVEGRLGAVERTLTMVHVGVDAIKDLLTRNINQENPES